MGTMVAGPHPGELLDVDRSYIVSWGRREVLWTLLAGCGLLALVSILPALGRSPLWLVLAVPVVLLAAFGVLFFRNPTRSVPQDPGILVSPADGTVWDITAVDESEFVREPCVRIGIFLSVFSVHVNRAPCSGRVDWVSYRKGAFLDARDPRAAAENESNSLGLIRQDLGGPQDVRVLVKQISGAIARRIVCPLAPGPQVARGGLLGMIKYGSRTELYVPRSSGAIIRVKPGDKVTGGETILVHWPQ